MNVIDSHNLERDAGGKPLHIFPHPALGRFCFDGSKSKARGSDPTALNQTRLRRFVWACPWVEPKGMLFRKPVPAFRIGLSARVAQWPHAGSESARRA
ncbi:MAG: hypothetical protein AB7O60_00570 [Variibacter sp.]